MQRISLIQDYFKILVIPTLHLSTISFFGMDAREQYLVWKETEDLFSALDSRLTLTTWKKTTGKPVPSLGAKLEKSAGLEGYAPFKSQPNDQSYLRNYFGNQQLLLKRVAETDVDPRIISKGTNHILHGKIG